MDAARRSLRGTVKSRTGARALVLLLAAGCGGPSREDRRTFDRPEVPQPTATLDEVLNVYPCPATYAPATDGPNQLCRYSYDDVFYVASEQTHSFILDLSGSGSAECVYDLVSSELVGIFVATDGGLSAKAGDLGDGDRPESLDAYRIVDCAEADPISSGEAPR